ncbi:MAG: IS110 family transposase [Armatimonadetes bacterium]|nr:IS110 family transposase [Armatimonadota bacterium]
MLDCSTYVGLDVHDKTIAAAMLNVGTGELSVTEFGAGTAGVKKLLRWVRQTAGESVRLCYEAGPSGYVLQRRLGEAGLDCRVIAPSLVYRRPGDRQKNDRRDARQLAQQLAHGQLTEVHPPTVAEEGVRALVRSRDDAQTATKRLKQQLVSMLKTWGMRCEGTAWSQGFREWLGSLQLPDATAQWVLENALLQLGQLEANVARLDAKIEEVAAGEPYREAVGRLRCFRGVDTLTAMICVAELYDFDRFASPRALMGYLGLVPSEASSGERERRGGITKTGNGLVRRVLVEAAWHYQHKPAVGATLKKRQQGQPAAVVAGAQRAMLRLNQRYWRLVGRGKLKTVAITAVARELVGFLWAALQGEAGQVQQAA